MNSKVLKTLEYDKVIDRLCKHADSGPGKALCRELLPMDERLPVERAQKETADAVNRIFNQGNVSFAGCVDLKEITARLRAEASLSSAELLTVSEMLERAMTLRDWSRNAGEDSLTPYFEGLWPLKEIRLDIRRCIDPDGGIRDEASDTLRSIRRELKAAYEKVRNALNRFITGREREYLMEPVITQRGMRYCVPVKSEYKSRVPGMVHDQSASGSTFFIEPASVVDINNEISVLKIKEQDEEERILMDLSYRLSDHTAELAADQELMAKLDLSFAKARLALEENAMRPVITGERVIKLKRARHPLLDPQTAVPIDVSLGDEWDMLIITGPNTGGKTVSLKTVGVLTLMAQAGMHIPASGGSELFVFKEVYADIGDEQSIDQNLSTFSGHMRNIVEILKTSDIDSLCLFDEPGAGTDPEEGAALAMALLDNFHLRRVRTMATTHFSELKLYALKTKGIMNASCEFDETTLSPTYRLLTGVPGKSNAFAISGRLGLPDYILREAVKKMDDDEKSFETVVSELESVRKELEKEREEIARERAELEKEKGEKKKRGKAEEKETVIKEPSHKLMKPEEAIPGTQVRAVPSNMRGVVVTSPDKRGRLTIRCGLIDVEVELKDLVPDRPDRKQKRGRVSSIRRDKALNTSSEINLTGMNSDDAIAALSKYIDDCVLANMSPVRVIHGKGNGILRKAVREHLKKNKSVKSFSEAGYGEGDAGVTVVRI
ncbi:MAG: Smr/MutS family protein [Lachnospiraceae bacterium]|nr:Smr/MutS family protein [Lachnospiraceae bacterium]